MPTIALSSEGGARDSPGKVPDHGEQRAVALGLFPLGRNRTRNRCALSGASGGRRRHRLTEAKSVSGTPLEPWDYPGFFTVDTAGIGPLTVGHGDSDGPRVPHRRVVSLAKAAEPADVLVTSLAEYSGTSTVARPRGPSTGCAPGTGLRSGSKQLMAPVPEGARTRFAVSAATVNREQQPGPSCRRRPSKSYSRAAIRWIRLYRVSPLSAGSTSNSESSTVESP